MNAVAIFKAQCRALVERAIEDGKVGIGLFQVLQWDIELAALLVMQHGMAMAERAALAVLTRQANGGAIGQNRGEGQFLGLSPVDAALVTQRIGTAFQ